MGDYRIEFERLGAFMIDEACLVDLCENAARFTNGKAQVEIDFEGKDTLVRSNDPKMLIGSEHVRTRRATSVVIFGHDWDKAHQTVRLALRIDDRFFHPVVFFSASGDEVKCAALKTRIDTVLNRTQAWYAPIFRPIALAPLALALLALSVLVFTVSRILLEAFGLTDPSLTLNALSVTIWALAAGFFARRTLFPKLMFDFGHSAKLLRRLEWARKVALAALLFGMLMTLVALLFVAITS